MTKWFALTLAVAAAFANDAWADKTIAVFTKNSTNPAYAAFRIAADQVARANGMKAIHFVSNKPDDIDEQKRFVEEVLQIRPDVVVLIPVDDLARALQALGTANRRAIVIGINGILPAIKQIENGRMLASVYFSMFKIGCFSMMAAVHHLNGQAVPQKLILPAEVIDKENYQAWLTPVEQRTCPVWTEVEK